MKEFLRPKMNLPIILLVIFSFVLIDQWIVPKLVAGKITASSEYRIPINFNFGQLRAFIDQINQDPNPKVILTGDSIVQGGGVGSGKDSIANFLQQEVGKTNAPYHVYNVGLSGASPADIYFMMKALELTDKDIIVYDVNIGHYGKGKKPLTFPKITAELSSKYDHGESLHQVLHLNADKLEDDLQLFVTNTWKFYAYREVIQSVYREKYYGKKQEQPEVNLNPWYKIDWTDEIKVATKRGAIQISEKDINLKFTKLLIEAASKDGARVLVFNIPLNQEMMMKYQMLDREKFDQNVKKLEQIFTGEGAAFQDYELLIPSPYFTDSLHPMREGNQMLAKRLHQDLKAWLEGKEMAP